jgi:hypothetical protein
MRYPGIAVSRRRGMLAARRGRPGNGGGYCLINRGIRIASAVFFGKTPCDVLTEPTKLVLSAPCQALDRGYAFIAHAWAASAENRTEQA